MAVLLNDLLKSTLVLVTLVPVIGWRLSVAFRRKSDPVPSCQAYRKWKSELGLTYRIKAAFGAGNILVLSDPVSIAYILQKKIYDYHHSRVVHPRVARLLGKGLGWVEGEAEHKRMRRLVSLSLSPMSSHVRVAALEVVDQFISHVQSGAEKPVNILDWTSKATLNVIGRVVSIGVSLAVNVFTQQSFRRFYMTSKPGIVLKPSRS
ncbi:hypothetical protein DICSQDRAFT_170950 [Dichomitus squalens LYAD-421 SS1]|uniref:Cytochrome P450 n=1 Tax=Dichomitus squalens (strain LYAD-421) TaxID=732165 RepID=R7SWP8_DICSQ|nr:uncharacterized protein DICSQDRAFT_170950 [Dichomitus squalens LYAD-421 SS1]EJF60506.1 hypothetical protein DICSQDRAFT_170950 [Dichomitus squalens LYAD-421 SS1]